MTTPTGDMFIQQSRILLTYFTLTALFYLTFGWVMQAPPPMLAPLADMLATDDTGIIALQIAAFFAFLALAAIQAMAAFAERAMVAGQQGAARLFFIPAGLPMGWPQKWHRLQPELDRADVVLGQHSDSRMALIRFLVAAFPTSGFIGTVLGIRKAIAPLDDLVASSSNMGNISSGLGDVVSGLEIAFNTTLVGLVFFLAGSLVAVLLATYLRRVHAQMLGG